MKMISFPATAVLLLFAFGCGRDPSVVGLKSYPSPNHKWIVTVLNYDPGAIGSVGTVLYMLPSGVRGRDPSDNILILSGRYQVNPTWKSDTELQVECVACSFQNAELVVTRKGGVSISYKADGE